MKRRSLLWAAAALAILAWLWLLSGQIRQMQMIGTYAVVLISAIAGLVSWLRDPGRTRRTKLTFLGGLFLAASALLATVRYRGLTGDWIPIFEWRWNSGPEWGERAETSLAEAPRSIRGEEPANGDAPSTVDTGPRAAAAEESDTPAAVVTPEEVPPLAAEGLSSPAAFPRFLGPDADSTLPGPVLAEDWEATPPRLVWQREVGSGWAGFAIADGRAYTLEQRDANETVVAYDLASGTELWVQAYPAHFSNPMGGPGPRTTPSIDARYIYTLGATGRLLALDRLDGSIVWRRDVVTENGSRLPEHGMSGSPLLVDDLVVVATGMGGPSLAAYDRRSGTPRWIGGRDSTAYAAPIVADLAGVRQILVFNAASVAGHAIEGGRVLWAHDYPSTYPNVATPLVLPGDRVLVSTGYGVGSKLYQIARDAAGAFSATLLWESNRLKAKFSNLVFHEGFVYSLDDGILVCLDPETGERRWKGGRYGHGSLLLVAGRLLVQTEKGDMVLIAPDPTELREVTRFTALEGKAWNHFALVAPYLLVRNDRRAALWEMPLAGSAVSGGGL